MYQAHFLIVLVHIGFNTQSSLSLKSFSVDNYLDKILANPKVAVPDVSNQCVKAIQNHQDELVNCSMKIIKHLQSDLAGVTDMDTINTYVCKAIEDAQSCLDVLKVTHLHEVVY